MIFGSFLRSLRSRDHVPHTDIAASRRCSTGHLQSLESRASIKSAFTASCDKTNFFCSLMAAVHHAHMMEELSPCRAICGGAQMGFRFLVGMATTWRSPLLWTVMTVKAFRGSLRREASTARRDRSSINLQSGMTLQEYSEHYLRVLTLNPKRRHFLPPNSIKLQGWH